MTFVIRGMWGKKVEQTESTTYLIENNNKENTVKLYADSSEHSRKFSSVRHILKGLDKRDM